MCVFVSVCALVCSCVCVCECVCSCVREEKWGPLPTFGLLHAGKLTYGSERSQGFHLIGSQQGTLMLPCVPYCHHLLYPSMPVSLNHTHKHTRCWRHLHAVRIWGKMLCSGRMNTFIGQLIFSVFYSVERKLHWTRSHSDAWCAFSSQLLTMSSHRDVLGNRRGNNTQEPADYEA